MNIGYNTKGGKKVTRSQAIRRHRKMWRWLAEHPGKEKHDWPGWEENGGPYRDDWAHCFLCSYAVSVVGEDSGRVACEECPLKWPDPKGTCTPLLAAWARREKGIAKQIAELPVRRRR